MDKNLALRLSEPVEAAYLNAVDQLIINFARHLVTGKAFRTSSWEVAKLSEIGQLSDENARIINEAVKRVPDEICKALDEASEASLETLETAVRDAIAAGRIEEAPVDTVQSMLQELAQQAVEQANLVNTVMLDSAQSAYTAAVTNTVQWVNQIISAEQAGAAQSILNAAVTAVEIGTDTRREALRKAISQMADNGIYGFVDRAGRHWSPDAYINMDIRTTVHNAAIQSVRNRQQDYGSEIFQVSTHPGARPLCYPYQGKFYTWGSVGGVFTDGDGNRHTYKPISSTSYGQAAGLFGIHCGHYPMPQIPGVTIPQDKQRQSKDANDKEYRESQKQRALERSIREAKRKAAAFDAAGLQEAFELEAVKVKQRQSAYNAFCKKAGRAKRIDRTQVAGYDKSVNAKATAAVKRTEKAKILEQEKYKQINYHPDGTIVVTDDWTAKKHVNLKPEYKPNAVVDTVSRAGKQRDRMIYGENARQKTQINSADHGNKKKHPFGVHGEHAHDIVWKDGKIDSRIARELTEQERKEHADIL